MKPEHEADDMGILDEYYLEIDELKKTKAFLTDLKPTSFDLKSMLIDIDRKLNEVELRVAKYRGENIHESRCGVCERGFTVILLMEPPEASSIY